MFLRFNSRLYLTSYLRSGNAAWHKDTLENATSSTAHFMVTTPTLHLLVITSGTLLY